MNKERDNYKRLASLGMFRTCTSPGRTHRSIVQGTMDLFAERISAVSTCEKNGQYYAALLAHYVFQENGVPQGNPEMLLRIYTDKKVVVPYQLNLIVSNDLLEGADAKPDMTAYLSHWLDELSRVGHGTDWDR